MNPRRHWLLMLGTVVLVILAAVIALFIRWWPDANRLTAYAMRGDMAGVRLCLRLGADPNEPCRWGWHHLKGETPLTAAAEAGRVEVVRLLLEKGADPNLRDFGSDYSHHTPLAKAAMQGHLEVCRVLFEVGADPNVPTHPKQFGWSGNWTALDWALQYKQAAAADFLRQHGAVESGRRSK